MINQAISRSEVAIEKGAKAELIEGRIQYSRAATTHTGREYRISVTLIEMLGLLHGNDIRAIRG